METVILPKRNHKKHRGYDRYLYWLRHLVENAFLHYAGGELLQDTQKSYPLFWL